MKKNRLGWILQLIIKYLLSSQGNITFICIGRLRWKVYHFTYRWQFLYLYNELGYCGESFSKLVQVRLRHRRFSSKHENPLRCEKLLSEVEYSFNLVLFVLLLRFIKRNIRFCDPSLHLKILLRLEQNNTVLFNFFLAQIRLHSVLSFITC